MLHKRIASLVVCCVLLAASVPLASAENWPGWRGPLGTGHSNQTDLPLKWSDADVAWRTPLEGRGQSSPVVWEDRIFLTTALEEGKHRAVICLDRATGKVRWQTTASTVEPEEVHRMNQWASATCATDGERVVAFFGRGGLHCFDMDGKKLWSRELGQFVNKWGTAASPVIHGELVVQNCEAESEDSAIVAVNKMTGETVWRTPRDPLRGWSTPILVSVDGRSELVVNGEKGINAYDLKTGKDLWFCKGDRGRGTPTVAPYKDLLIAVSGRPGDMFATRGGGSGVVNETHEAWRTKRSKGRDLPSPIIVGDFLFVITMNGIASCYDPASGKELDTLRIGGNFSASPIAAGGLVYLPNEDGEVIVVRPGKKLEIVAKNSVVSTDDELFRASLTPSNGQILLRSDRVLYCIGKAAK